MFTTPEGMLSSEVVPEGVYVPEVVVSKNVRKARGRFKVSLMCVQFCKALWFCQWSWGEGGRSHAIDMPVMVLHVVGRRVVVVFASPRTQCAPSFFPSQAMYVLACLQTGNRAFATADDESDDEPAPPPKASAGPGRPSAAAGRGAGRGGPGAGGGGKGPKDAATRQAEFRQKKLQEEAEVRPECCAQSVHLLVLSTLPNSIAAVQLCGSAGVTAACIITIVPAAHTAWMLIAQLLLARLSLMQSLIQQLPNISNSSNHTSALCCIVPHPAGPRPCALHQGSP